MFGTSPPPRSSLALVSHNERHDSPKHDQGNEEQFNGSQRYHSRTPPFIRYSAKLYKLPRVIRPITATRKQVKRKPGEGLSKEQSAGCNVAQVHELFRNVAALSSGKGFIPTHSL